MSACLQSLAKTIRAIKHEHYIHSLLYNVTRSRLPCFKNTSHNFTWVEQIYNTFWCKHSFGSDMLYNNLAFSYATHNLTNQRSATQVEQCTNILRRRRRPVSKWHSREHRLFPVQILSKQILLAAKGCFTRLHPTATDGAAVTYNRLTHWHTSTIYWVALELL